MNLVSQARSRLTGRRAWIAALTALTVVAGTLHAASPARADDTADPVDRSYVVTAWQTGGAQVRAAAEAALVGTDAQVRDFLTTGWAQAEQLDERDTLVDVIASGGPAVRAAAQNALAAADAGDAGAIPTFIQSGWQQSSGTDTRLSVDQLMAAGGTQTKAAAQRVLDSDDPDVMRQFLDTGWQGPWQTDQRLQIDQAMAAGGPEVQAAAQRALDAGTPEALQEFLDYGWDVAAARDDEVATLSSLLGQAEAASDTATQQTQQAVDEAARADAASKAAEQAAATAAQATVDAKANAKEAAFQAGRAATAAQKAADAAKVAIDAANAASQAAHAAATAASRAAAAAARASQQATNAYNAAAAAASDRTKAADARKAAEDANAIAQQAENFADTAEAAGNALQASLSAITDARSAAQHALDAAADNLRAAEAAEAAGADASAAVNAAKAAQADANRANQAAQSAQNYLNVAIGAAFAARDAARRAAADARAAATAATDAANDAGDAAQAATRATAYANAATTAAQAAVDAASQAIGVYNAARQADTDRIAVEQGQGVADAQDASAAYDAQVKATDWDLAQAAQRTAETNQLIAEAQDPSTAPDVAVTDGRKVALALATAQGAFTQAAAQAALGGTDADVLEYIRTGLAAAAGQDDRQAVMDLATTGPDALATAAQTALNGTDADVAQFLRTQDYPGRATQDRLKVDQIMSAATKSGDTWLAQAAQQALDAYTDQALRDFLDSGQYTAATTGQRLQVDNIAASDDSGPELKAAAQVALDGPPTAIAEFLSTGRYTAMQRDGDSAAHLAVVDGILDKTNEAAQTAVQHAQEAQEAAANARGDAATAADWASKAAASAQAAAGYATAAANSANQASESVQKASDAVQTARAAATRADASAQSAIASSTWAIASQQKAVQAAHDAASAAKQAKQSALDAGADATAAAQAGLAAYDAYQQQQGKAIGECWAEYRDGPASDLEKALGGSGDDWYQNCVRNVIPDPDELANRAYVNSAYCDVYPEGSQLYQNCLHQVLDPEFRGMQKLEFLNSVVLSTATLLLPVAAVTAAGCLVTVCGAVIGTLLTVGDVGLNLFKLINGDQSLADTVLNLGEDALSALAFDGVGKLLGVTLRQLDALRETTQAAKIAEAELKDTDDARQWLLGLANCSIPESFAAGTAVLMADGSSRDIADVHVGDAVLATDPRTGESASEPVTGVSRHQDTALADVDVRTGSAVATVHTTAGHPFWSASAGSWTAAADLTPGTRLVSAGDAAATVVRARSYTGDQPMYDLTVARLHTFSVLAGTTPVLVHNKEKSACPESIALGLSGETLDELAVDTGAKMYMDFPEDWNWYDVVKTLLSPDSTGTVYFALDGIDGYTYNGVTVHTPSEFAALANDVDSMPPPVGLFTAWELRMIRDAPQSVRDRVVFYYEYRPYTLDPFTQWEP